MTQKRCEASGKLRYPSADAARGALNRVTSRGRAENGYYRCGACLDFHLTHRAVPRRLRRDTTPLRDRYTA